ncbi:hypothetical protein Tco_0120613 [Tanacetum coccineum]
MFTMAENVITVRAENGPPMLDKSQCRSWRSRILLYIKFKEHGKKLYDSVINEPFNYGTVAVLGTQTTPASIIDITYDELTYVKKIREGCDIKATDMVLQGLPQDIYNLVNHHTDVKDIWDKVKLLIKGSSYRIDRSCMMSLIHLLQRKERQFIHIT